jgi:hypothetical protein
VDSRAIPVDAEDLNLPDCLAKFLFEFRLSSSRLMEKSLFSPARHEAAKTASLPGTRLFPYGVLEPVKRENRLVALVCLVCLVYLVESD